jgi:hypothetical protein
MRAAGAGTGDPIDGTAAQAKTALAITASDVSGLAAIATSGSASDLTAGTVPAARMPALTGDVTTSAGAVATTLATVNSNVGTFGSATQASQITVNAKGLITAAANVTITPAASSITGGQALTKTDDTNVTLTLGGTPTSALLTAASLTLGWTGTLAVSRGGTGASSLTSGFLLLGNGTSAVSASIARDTGSAVGIGTSPTDRLHVRQDQDGTTAIQVHNRNGSGTPVSAIRFITSTFDLSDNRYAMIASSGGASPNMEFWTSAGAAPTKRAQLSSGGSLTMVASGSTLGYGTGAGGSVTQLTSKATGVTLNTGCGQITMNNAALAAATTVSFVVTNSNVAATDSIILNLVSGQATNGTYSYWIEKVAAGSFTVTVENRSAGSLSEALVLNFAVIKGATS